MTQDVVGTEHNPVNPISVDSNGDVITDKNGNPATNVNLGGVSDGVSLGINNPSGIPFTKTFTVNSAADLFTDPTAPVAAELFTVTIPAGKQRCKVRFHTQDAAYVQSATSDIPWASCAVATINAADATNALVRLTLADNGASATPYTTDDLHRIVSPLSPIISWDTQDADVDITRVDIGAIPSTDTGAIPVYITVEAW